MNWKEITEKTANKVLFLSVSEVHLSLKQAAMDTKECLIAI